MAITLERVEAVQSELLPANIPVIDNKTRTTITRNVEIAEGEAVANALTQALKRRQISLERISLDPDENLRLIRQAMTTAVFSSEVMVITNPDKRKRGHLYSRLPKV